MERRTLVDVLMLCIFKKGQMEQHFVSESFSFKQNKEHFGSAGGYHPQSVSDNSRVRHSSLDELGSSEFFVQQLASSAFLALGNTPVRHYSLSELASLKNYSKISDRRRSSYDPRIMKLL